VGYQLFDHTADAGLEAWGDNPASAFEQAALGMFEIVLGREPSEASGDLGSAEKVVSVEGHDWEALLVNWLAAFVFYFDVEGFVPLRFSFEECEPPRCQVSVAGVIMDEAEQVGGVLIKAITYHQLEVNVTSGRTDLRVIFDI